MFNKKSIMFDSEIKIVRLLLEDTVNYTLSFLYEKDQKQGIITIKPLRPSRELLESIKKDQMSLSFENDIYSSHNVLIADEAEVSPTKQHPAHSTITNIYPATQRHIMKLDAEAANLDGKRMLVREDATKYENTTLPWILREELDWDGRLKWIKNIFSGEKEAELVIKRQKEYVILPDSKWSRDNVQMVYVLLLFTDLSLHSVRDLMTAHLPLLKEISTYIHSGSLFKDLSDAFGGCVASSKDTTETTPSFRAYFHYLPSYFQLHLHITHVDMGLWNAQVGQSILLEDLIDQLENGISLRDKTFHYYLSPTHPLHHLQQ